MGDVWVWDCLNELDVFQVEITNETSYTKPVAGRSVVGGCALKLGSRENNLDCAPQIVAVFDDFRAQKTLCQRAHILF